MKTHLKYWTKSFALGLSILIALPPVHAQTPLPTELNIVVVEGEGATNNVRQRVAREPVVRVEDENHKPIAGAAVVFTLPTEGATGEFANGAKSLTIMTDSQGRATAQGLRLNQVAGKIPIHVNASYRGLTARTSITQFSVLPPGAKASSGSPVRRPWRSDCRPGRPWCGRRGGGAYFATRSNNSVRRKSSAHCYPYRHHPGTGTIVGGH